jgi:threonine/homoserine/homoserine lactone efflux protein
LQLVFVTSRSLTPGRRAGLATALGNAVGVHAQMPAIAIGLGTIVEQSLAVFTVVKLVGAAYLIHLGVQAIRHRRSLATGFAAKVEPKSTRQIVLDAFLSALPTPRRSSSPRSFRSSASDLLA